MIVLQDGQSSDLFVRQLVQVNSRPWITGYDRCSIACCAALLFASLLSHQIIPSLMFGVMLGSILKRLNHAIEAQTVTAIRSVGIQINSFRFSNRMNLLRTLIGLSQIQAVAPEGFFTSDPSSVEFLAQSSVHTILINEVVDRCRARFCLIAVIKPSSCTDVPSAKGRIIELFDHVQLSYRDMRKALAILRRVCLEDETLIEE